MIEETTIKLVTNYCVKNLDFTCVDNGWDYYYSSMPLCVIDSVFSIGVRYGGVINTINNVTNFYNINRRALRKHVLPDIKNQLSTSDFINKLSKNKTEELINKVFNNRQRTSSKNGITKVEAVIKFLHVLKDFNVEYYQDIKRLIHNESFEFCIKRIPGQKSGICLNYFFMLTGSSDIIKPDRRIIRFLYNITNKKFNLSDCQKLVIKVADELNKRKYKITPQRLDSLMWNYQPRMKAY